MEELPKAELRRLRSLRNEKGRQEYRLFLAEGYRLVDAALDASAPVLRVLMTEAFSASPEGRALGRKAEAKAIATAVVSENTFAQIATTTHTQGVLAVVRTPGWPDQAPWKSGLMVALSNVRDPGNVGTIWRAAAWFGADRIILGKGCVDPHNPKVVRATMGGLFYVPCEPVEDLANWLAAARAAGYKVFAADVQGETDHWPAEAPEVVLVAGGETEGLSPQIRRVVETTIRIPRWGAGDSLNVAMAVSILLDRWRQARPA
ncbi:MAG: RNA methyltransferase [candidate division KSB1 bacterium]|nr:RNA methyltransferase [candidate division KSB1 bacterium]